MVSRFSIGFVMAIPTLAVCAQIRFRTEFAKKSFYEGESVATHFVIYAEEERLDVEVMRFPEFRGFWSENFVLKQGPIQLLPALMQSLTFPNGFPSMIPKKAIPFTKPPQPDHEVEHLSRSVVGSYTLHRMIGRTDSMIRPMKLQVKRPLLGVEAELELESEVPAIEIKPLPSLPAGGVPFLRAVGNFTLRVEGNEILYRSGEASLFRVMLLGDGNFPEVNELPLQFPEGVKLLGMKAYGGNMGGIPSKVFEYSLEVTGDGTYEVPPQPFLYFDPLRGKYETLQSPTLHIAPMPKEASPPKERLSFEPQEVPTQAVSLEDSHLFWLIQMAIAAVFGTLFCRRWWRALVKARMASGGYQDRQRWKEIRETVKDGRSEIFLRRCVELLLGNLQRRQIRGLKVAPAYELLRNAEGLSDVEKKEMQFLIETHAAFIYGKKDLPEGATERISRLMQEIVRKAG